MKLPPGLTYRRHLLDRHLARSAARMQGVVVDLGGERRKRRGFFRPPTGGRWIVLNVSIEAAPTVIADATRVPLADASADCVLCTEVLEHLPEPGACVDEAHRILRPGGILLASVPFLFPVHADPGDYQRLTTDGLRRLLARFGSVSIGAMGGYWGVLGMFIELGSGRLPGARWQRSLAARVGRVIAHAMYRADRRSDGGPPGYTTGYFAEAIK